MSYTIIDHIMLLEVDQPKGILTTIKVVFLIYAIINKYCKIYL